MGGGSDVFPVANSTRPYWRSELHEIDNYRSTEELPRECDVLIVGAGLSGVSTAYHLLSDNPSPPSVVLLEAREICSGATGRNGGHLRMAWSYINSMRKEYGEDAAKELALFQAAQVFAMKDVVQKEKLDCDFVLTRSCEASISQPQAEEMMANYEELVQAGLDYVQDVDFVGPKYAERVSGIKGAKAASTVTGAQLWPYKFVTSLLARLLEKTSINVQTHTPVTLVAQSRDGLSLALTARGSILAKKVVFATNAYTSGIAPLYSKTIIPRKGTCSHIQTPEETQHPPPHLMQTYGLTFEAGIRDYLVPRPDGGVICGGANATFIQDRKSWWNNFDDSTLIEPARKHFETVMQDNFRGWEKSEAFVDYLWTGIMGSTPDSQPHCGKIPEKDGHYILAGFNGGGMTHIYLTAKGIAKMIREGVSFEESGIPRIFKTTKERMEQVWQ